MLKKFIKVICTPLVLVVPTLLTAETSVVSSGSAHITSNLNKEVFRARAIEKALHNIVLDGDQNLKSFSLVENGRVLLDQIEASSNIEIVQYEIVDESIKNQKYHVTINAITRDKEKTAANRFCKKVAVKEVNFSLNLNVASEKLPPWAIITQDWIIDEIKKHRFKKNFRLPTNDSEQKSENNLYSLYEANETVIKDNLYRLNVHLNIDGSKTHNFGAKTDLINVKLNTQIFRGDTVLLKSDTQLDYNLHKKYLNNLFISINRGDWENTKSDIITHFIEHLDAQLSELDCLNITPKLTERAGIPFLNYGSLDGISKSDMFLISSNATKKTYFKVVNIGDHSTELEFISQKQDIKNLIGKDIEVVEGS